MRGITRTAAKKRRAFQRWFRDWTERVRDRGRSHGFFEPYPAGLMMANALIGIGIAIAGVVLSVDLGAPVGAPAIIGGIVIALLTPLLIRHSREGRRLYLAWSAFKAHLRGMERSHGPVSLDSRDWGLYLGLAVVLGVHKKLLARLQPIDAAGQPASPVWFSGGHGGVGDGASAFSSSVSSMVASMSSAMSSASGAGGGASAGGGGGGGGGGGCAG
jgi:hypothetical protein